MEELGRSTVSNTVEMEEAESQEKPLMSEL